MAQDTDYPGHEGSNKPPVGGDQLLTPGTYAPLDQNPQGVNQKTELGKDGKA